MTIPFWKMSAAGNDFIVIDHRQPILDEVAIAAFARDISTFHTGVGADGIILLENAEYADFAMRYYNADGSRGEMCGNGARALGAVAQKKHLWEESALFMADDGDHVIRESNGVIGISLNVSTDYQPVELAGLCTGFHLNTGVPHFVTFVEDLSDVAVEEKGRSIRLHPEFQPAGTNVDFVEIAEPGLKMRTYERGVEHETLACGTGVMAAGVIAVKERKFASPVGVEMPGGRLEITRDEGTWMLWGPVEEVFSGELVLGNRLNKYII